MARRFALALLWLLPALALADSAGHPVTMWMAEGTSNRVYLLGSVHLLRAQDHPLPQVIDNVYDDAETLYMELDMDDLDPLLMQSTINRLGMLDDGTSLRDVMGDDLYAEAMTVATELDIPLEMLERTEPWFAAITIEQLALARIGFNPSYGVEMHLLQKATRDGKAILGFESVEQQLAYLDGLSLDAQRELLMQTLTESATIREIMDDLILAWRSGDIDYLEQTLLEDVSGYPELYDTIVANRNRLWVDTIDELLQQGEDYLVVVGALHLVGEDGLPQLLEQRGVRILQMHELRGIE
ncbi:MAG: TraB/GumN family protein [Gammaproteobacteria bacterium]|nr:TraB/GumN family protein [Gammaproteobacteria bacterium]MDH3847113.1 TraB/GumN family protein [Gammaproteobacteria bacterium]MDH3862527.1 TraB/GumN family protein [Gammaproteobacteria bacterium]MDH3906853.1 TraB/GumN family protein [Gammaproteobacteria bacterium]MDH3954306.1 TraB/GumN family protein [Gammaproteobacteria bacterium]